ncbi:MAG: DUF4235 domain-containing protein [Propionibacteriaceae bacterium]|jgi:hypothetical protein|nr:DUF4235 domain-containing protein [Propionibacteriaceae bacterium]
MGRAIVERIYTAIAVGAVSAVAGFCLRRVWRWVTGDQPPDPRDPEAPVRQALVWLVLSSLVGSLASLAITRGAGRLTAAGAAPAPDPEAVETN